MTSKKIDSLALLPDGQLLISTNGDPSVTGITTNRDEDVLALHTHFPSRLSENLVSIVFHREARQDCYTCPGRTPLDLLKQIMVRCRGENLLNFVFLRQVAK